MSPKMKKTTEKTYLFREMQFQRQFLILPVPEKLKNTIFVIPTIPETLKFTPTFFEILLFEIRSLLRPAQRVTGSRRVKISVKNQKIVRLLL